MLDVEDGLKLEDAVKALQPRNITVLINNVAGELNPRFLARVASSADRNRRILNGNFVFAAEVTRLMPPQLVENKPSLVMNIGSGSANLPCPYFGFGAAAKTCLQSFSPSLAAEMVAEGHPQVEVIYNIVGLCSTSGDPRPVTFLVPDARQFAKSSLSLVGHGYRKVWGYWPNASQFEPLLMLPGGLVEMLCIALVKRMRAEQADKQDN